MAKNQPVDEAIASAKTYITEAIRYAPSLGHGHGPVEHFWRIQKEQADTKGNQHE